MGLATPSDFPDKAQDWDEEFDRRRRPEIEKLLTDEVIAEHEANPLGYRDFHRWELQRVLNYFRAHTDLLDPTDGNWDCADLKGYELDDPRVKAIHYTRIETQLHLKYALPRLRKEGGTHWYTGDVFTHQNADLIARFDRLYEEAIAAGYNVDQYRVKSYGKAQRKDFSYKKHVGTAVSHA